jgi:putative hydrolase of the HAD superfamily
MLSAPANLPRWHEIDTVLLDLDGTLLDLAFDNYVWLGRIPELYAEAHGLSVPEAQAALAPKFRALQGTLDWYCIEHWSRALEIDIEGVHRDEAHRIAWLPGARGFLERLRELRKRLVLLTNSHPTTLAIKHEQTGVLDYFDAAFSSKQFGAPKEDARFWSEARAAEPFEPARSVFVDDSAVVLRAARAAGIRWVFAVRRPDTSRRGHAHEEFTAVDSVAELG